MKVFVFQPNNEFIGRFEIAGLEGLEAGFEQFRRGTPVGGYVYLECAGKTWTAVPEAEGLGLVEGRIKGVGSPVASSSPLVGRYLRGYRAGSAAVGFGNVLKGIGWVAGMLKVVVGMLQASWVGGAVAIGVMIEAIIVAAIVVVGFMVLAVLVRTLGEILRAALDTAVQSSPFLDLDQKSEVIEAGMGER